MNPLHSATTRARITAVANTLGAVELLGRNADAVVDTWQELCQWDPLLPPDSRPPMARAMVRAVASALARPQPVGWGLDPEVQGEVERFAGAAGSLENAIGQLVCLGDAIRRQLRGSVPPGEEAETLERVTMVIDRAIGLTAARAAAHLEEQAYLDPLTGLFNRRGLDRDLRAELGRASRHGRPFTVVTADLVGLKTVNDREGHAAGDAMLQTMAKALCRALRAGDQAYRVGGDEFVVLLPEAHPDTADVVAQRVSAAGGPVFTWGAASFPDDATDAASLLDSADRRLLAKRAVPPPSTA